jgi:DnaK suppressor protein
MSRHRYRIIAVAERGETVHDCLLRSPSRQSQPSIRSSREDIGMNVNVDEYRERLLALEAQIVERSSRAQQTARELIADSPGDTGDASVVDLGQSEELTEVQMDATLLQQVRDALQRIDDGTFGRCVVDGQPIEPKRLEAAPWTPYCITHQRQAEAASPTRRPSL